MVVWDRVLFTSLWLGCCKIVKQNVPVSEYHVVLLQLGDAIGPAIYRNVRSERCDACRIIARRFDSALGAADSAIQVGHIGPS